MTEKPTAAEIVSFWQAAGYDRWFKKDEAFDDEIRSRFLGAYEDAAAGQYNDWEKTAEGALALLILLDQFPRNMFRGQARAFETDVMARAITAGAMLRGFDSQVPADLRLFFYVPFEHSEDLADQERGVALYKAAGDADGLKWAEIHADIIRRFPASQPCARPRHHAGRAGVSRRRRLCRVSATVLGVRLHDRLPRRLSLSRLPDRCVRPH